MRGCEAIKPKSGLNERDVRIPLTVRHEARGLFLGEYFDSEEKGRQQSRRYANLEPEPEAA